MYRFLTRFGNAILTMILALGWAWSGILKELRYINDGQRFILLILLTVILAIQQIYLEYPKPAKREIVENRRKIVENQLERFLEEYYEILLSRFGKNHAFPIVRTNIMLPTKKFRGIFGTHLRIYYWFCAGDSFYTDQELQLEWKKEEGTCGWAWGKKNNSIYDSRKKELTLPAKRLNKSKTPIVHHIHSTLSIPIWLEGSVVGVLNLDSKQNIKDTLLTDAEVISLSTACSQIISGQCHENGVEG